MRALITTSLLGLALAAPPIVARSDEAKPRGGSSGSSSASAAGRHPSSGGHAVGQPSGRGGGYAAPGGSYSASSGRGRGGYGGGGGGYGGTGAQARHPRPGTGHGYRYPGGYYGGGYGYYPYYGDYYWPYWGWGFYGGWGYPYGWGVSAGWGYPYGGWGYPYGGGYGYSSYDAEIGSLRLIVEPNKAKVYVDGSYAGKVDDFDGVFQRLQLPRGRHDIAIKLDGYQTHRLRVYVSPSHTMKIRFEMTKGGGEVFEDLTADMEDVAEARPPREPEAAPEPEAGEPERREPARMRAEVTGPGILRLDVRPVDATVYVDGEFRGAAGALERLTLAPGRHLLEVVRPGFRTVQREVEIRPGKTEEIAVDLERS